MAVDRVKSCVLPTLAALCVAGMAAAQTADLTPNRIEGRWASDSKTLMLDIARCGAGWCGVEVSNGSACGATALRVQLGTRTGDGLEFNGRFQRAAKAQTYAVSVRLFHNQGRDRIMLVGNTGDRFEAFRRTFPLTEYLARIGDVQCSPEPGTS